MLPLYDATMGKALSHFKQTQQVLTITKAPNRRFYVKGTPGYGYVTLYEIQQLIREGKEVQVFDRTTLRDITQETLWRVIVNMEREYIASLNDGVLRELICLQTGPDVVLLSSFLEVMTRLFDPQGIYRSGDSVDPILLAGRNFRAWTGNQDFVHSTLSHHKLLLEEGLDAVPNIPSSPDFPD